MELHNVGFNMNVLHKEAGERYLKVGEKKFLNLIQRGSIALLTPFTPPAYITYRRLKLHSKYTFAELTEAQLCHLCKNGS